MFFLKAAGWSGHETIVHGFGVRETPDEEMTKKDFRGRTITQEKQAFPLVALRQVHGDTAIVFTGRDQKPEEFWSQPGDALITQAPGFALTVFTADCLPILLFEPKQKVIAAIHAGWKGTAKGIARRVIGALIEGFHCRAKDIQAALGPYIGPCCYEVDQPVREAFGGEGWPWDLIARPRAGGNWSLDLSAANVLLMKEQGVEERNIRRLAYCTCCQRDLFCSYRRENKTKGRQLNFIALK